MFAWPYDTPRRGGAIPERPFGEFDACTRRLDARRRAVHAMRPATPRTGGARACSAAARTTGDASRCASGRTTSSARALDGLGDDWPISYDDIKPYYDKVDRLIGIFGSDGESAQRAGRHLPAAAEAALLRAADQGGVRQAEHPGIPSRLSILTQPLNGRPACHYCGQCGRGCRTHSNFSSPSVLLPPALATGQLTLITNAMAREVTVDQSGLATACLHRQEDRTATTTCARASSCSRRARASRRGSCSTRSRRSFPHGLANSSGVVGKYLTDSTGTGVSGFIPKMVDDVPHNEDGVGGMHLYMPWWLDNKKLDFPRGYHIEVGGGRRMPSVRLHGRHPQFTGIERRAADRVRRLRQAAQGRLPPLLRRDGRASPAAAR